MKRVDQIVRSDAAGLDTKDQTNIRFYAAMDAACTAIEKASPTPQDVGALTVATITDDAIVAAMSRVLGHYRELGATDQTAKGPDLVSRVEADLARRLAGAHPAACAG